MDVAKKILIVLLMTAWAQQAFAMNNLRKCLLLPITDDVSGSIGTEVFTEVETYLKRSDWCDYQHSSQLFDVLSKYRLNLSSHLQNKDVLKTLAQRTEAGSIIRASLVNHISGIEVKLDILGEDGEDVLFSEKTLLKTKDVELIATTVNNWLMLYGKSLPYDGLVIGVVGDQVTIDLGKNLNARIGDKFNIKKLKAKKRHPLLKTVVEWETQRLGEGKIFNTSQGQAVGVVKRYYGNGRIEKGDWVTIKRELSPQKNDEYTYPEVKLNEFGKLGEVAFSLAYSSSSASSVVNGENKKISGGLLGFMIDAELWITRNYFAGLEFYRSFGTLNKKSGNLQQEAVNLTAGTFKLIGGYKYLPLGFFYGPQINLYGGYGQYSYNLDSITADGWGENSFKGIILGAKAEIPLEKTVRIFAKIELMPFASFEEDTEVFGGARSESVMELEFGGRYQYNPLITLDASVVLNSNKAKFDGAYSELHYRDTIIKAGASFNF